MHWGDYHTWSDGVASRTTGARQPRVSVDSYRDQIVLLITKTVLTDRSTCCCVVIVTTQQRMKWATRYSRKIKLHGKSGFILWRRQKTPHLPKAVFAEALLDSGLRRIANRKQEEKTFKWGFSPHITVSSLVDSGPGHIVYQLMASCMWKSEWPNWQGYTVLERNLEVSLIWKCAVGYGFDDNKHHLSLSDWQTWIFRMNLCDVIKRWVMIFPLQRQVVVCGGFTPRFYVISVRITFPSHFKMNCEKGLML